MSKDFRVTNKQCDHTLRSVRYQLSTVDCKTLLPKSDLSLFFLSDPINTLRAELKSYNPISRTWRLIPQDDPNLGWSIQQFPVIADMPSLGLALQIQFNFIQPSSQGMWLLTYQTLATDCIKCSGGLRVTDVVLVGDPDKALYLQYEAKLAQDFLKMLITPRGSDPYYTWMGTSLADLPGRKYNQNDVTAMLSQQISEVADAIKNLQAQQVTIYAQQMSPREMLDSVSSVTFNVDAYDPRVLLIKIELYTMSRTLATIQFPVST